MISSDSKDAALESVHILTAEDEPVEASFTLKVANDMKTRERAYRLLYALYRDKGITQSNSNEMLYSLRNSVPETTTLFVEHEEETVAVLTFYQDSPLGLPADEAYEREVNAMRDAGDRLCEFGSLGVAPGFLANGEIVPRLFEAAVVLAYDIRKRTHAVIECHPSHARLYCDLLEFEQVGAEGSLENRNGAPVVLLRKNLGELERRHDSGIAAAAWRQGALAKSSRTGDSRRQIGQELKRMLQPMSEEELRYFFIEGAPILDRAPKMHRDYVKSRYSGYLPWHLPATAAS